MVNFVFTEETGYRRRPGVIVSSDLYHRDRQEAIIAAVTSNTERLLAGDYLLLDWIEAGLLFPSVVTGIIRTIKQSLVIRNLGSLSSGDMRSVELSLRLSLGLSG